MTKRRGHGEGTIHFWEEKNLWVAKVTLPDGRRKTKYGKSQKELKEWLLAIRKAAGDGTLADGEKLRLAEFLEQYLQDYGQHALRASTFRSYSNLIRLHIVPELGNIKLPLLRPHHLHTLYARKREAGLSDRTVQYIHGLLHRALNKALKWGIVTRNVADLADTPPNKRKAMHVWNSEQVRAFLESVRDDRWAAIYFLACGTGMRQGEILGLLWREVDLEAGTLKVTRSAQSVRGQGIVFSEPKSEKSRRLIHLPSFVVSALQRHCEAQTELRKKPGWHEHGLVVTTGNGTPILPRNLVRHFKSKIQVAGVPEIRFHDLRHTTASLLLERNTHPKVVQELLGHSQITLTLDTYSHVIPTLQREAAKTMDTLVGNL